jgi:osmotically-inducible protein OsmY
MIIPTRNPLGIAAAVLAAAVAVAGTETDERILAAARGSYNFRTYLKDERIGLAAKNGTVTLTGSVQNAFQRAPAEETVAGLPAVKGVNDQLSVRDEPGGLTPDAILRARIQAALLLHRDLHLVRTQVDVDSGVATLRGEADSEAQKQLATDFVKDLDGVARVDNQMTVAGAHPRRKEIRKRIDDASITAQIKLALLFNRSTSALKTKVRTENGVVTLTGTARSKAERDLVGRIARNVEGIRAIRNKVTIRSGAGGPAAGAAAGG